MDGWEKVVKDLREILLNVLILIKSTINKCFTFCESENENGRRGE